MTMTMMFDYDSIDVPTLIMSVVAALAAGIAAMYLLLDVWATSAYASMLHDPVTSCDIDAFVSRPPSKIKVALAHTLRMGGRTARTNPIPLECVRSKDCDGLYVSRHVKHNATDDPLPLDELLKKAKGKEKKKNNNSNTVVVVATIRMGFGHHRLAYSACSWALQEGYTTIFHDLLNVESDESDLIRSVDALYSKFSRWASEVGGPFEALWGRAMKQGDEDALRIAALTAAHLQPLLTAYPKDVPLVTTHQLCALIAAAAGFTNVVNLVVDNYPQWFLVVPKTLNLTQGPVNYQSYLKMGVPANELRLAGHWCPAELVQSIDADCQRRIVRAGSKAPGGAAAAFRPRRLLIPVGGAGAQKTFIVNLIETIQDLVKEGKLQLFLNAGDHSHMKDAFVDVLTKCGLDYDTVTTTQGVKDFQRTLLDDANAEPSKPITLFAFDEYFPAVAATDILCRVSDVLTCKPSELAFYPIPKLHIRRVGDHEADSARRAAEVGDGSLEAREQCDAMQYVQLILEHPSDLLISWNNAIVNNNNNNNTGMYDGCRNAVRWAAEGTGTGAGAAGR